MYVRDGTNPQFPPIGHYIWIDADGMLHSVRFADPSSKENALKTNAYENRYIETSGYLIEKSKGKAIWPEVTSMANLQFLLNLIELWIEYILGIEPIKPPFIKNTANTNVLLTAGKALALYEFGNPTLIEPYTLQTLNRDFNLEGWKHHFTAHPKVDPDTKELIGFGYNFPLLPKIWVCFLKKKSIDFCY